MNDNTVFKIEFTADDIWESLFGSAYDDCEEVPSPEEVRSWVLTHSNALRTRMSEKFWELLEAMLSVHPLKGSIQWKQTAEEAKEVEPAS